MMLFSYYAAQVEGYQFMKNVHSLSQLQDVLKIKGILSLLFISSFSLSFHFSLFSFSPFLSFSLSPSLKR